jgi:hypothetical protein
MKALCEGAVVDPSESGRTYSSMQPGHGLSSMVSNTAW